MVIKIERTSLNVCPSFCQKPGLDVIVALIRNKNYLVITAASGDILEPSGLGAARYHVLNKQNNTWNTITIRGEKTWLRSFNGWLAGTILTAFKGKESL
jgi:hypothetical protein